MKLDDLNFTGTELTVRKSEVERTSVLKKMNSMFDQFAKLVFLFDVSGSMSGHVAKSYEKQYLWTDAILMGIRNAAQNAVIDYNTTGGANLLADDMEVLKLADDVRGLNGELMFTPDDDDLKQRVVRHDLLDLFKIYPDFSGKVEKAPTRIELVKKLAKSELQSRFDKFPDSRIAVIPFGDQPAVMFDDGAPADLWPSLDRLQTSMYVNQPDGRSVACGGGTDILAGIRKAMDVCRANPSSVGIHHFIVVSDGEDSVAADNIGAWVPAMKASGIVLDYIHIGDRNVNQGIADACKALGGDAVTVNSEKDFEEKFIQAVQRKLLPQGN
jgi:hypothetical protein